MAEEPESEHLNITIISWLGAEQAGVLSPLSIIRHHLHHILRGIKRTFESVYLTFLMIKPQ